MSSCRKSTFLGVDAYIISAGGYEATIVPECGGNAVQLCYLPLNAELLRTPETYQDLTNTQAFYGMPLLLPPNRIYKGIFKSYSTCYKMPLNSRDGNHFIHGIIRNEKWTVSGIEADSKMAKIILKYYADKSGKMFTYFPHLFELTVTYELSSKGLSNQLIIHNLGDTSMPVGVGYHTALRVPFLQGGHSDDYRLKMAVAKKWELNHLMLPTGVQVEDEDTLNLLGEGIVPLEKEYSTVHFSAERFIWNHSLFNGAVLTDVRCDTSVVYEVDEKMKHWVYWNDGGKKGYCCPEPMSWMINAPNVKLCDEITGFSEIPPKHSWSTISKLYIMAKGSVYNNG